MTQISQEELTIVLWRMQKGLVPAELEIKDLRSFNSCRSNWLRFAREALLYSTVQAGQLLGVSRQTFIRFEEREISGQITLERLRAAADALGCELVYAIRPREGLTFAEASWARLAPEVEAKSARQVCLPHMRARLKVAIASQLLESRKNLKRFGFSRQR